MGYESMFIIGERAVEKMFSTDPGLYVNVIATMDVSKLGVGRTPAYVSACRKTQGDDKRYYFYGLDGNTQFYEDKYGDPLTELNLDDLVRTVEEDISTDGYPTYRRLPPLIALLREFSYQVKEGRWGDRLVVLHYGH